MAIVPMQKVAIVAHHSVREELIQSLHEEGLVEVTEAKEPVGIDHTEVDYRKGEVQFAIGVLKDVAAKETLAAAGKKANVEEVMHTARHTDVLGIVQQLRALEESDTGAEREIQEARVQQQQLAPWLELPYDLQSSLNTSATRSFTGSLPESQLPALRDACTAELPRTELVMASVVEGQAYCVAHVWHQDAKRFEQVATGLGWTTTELPAAEGTARHLHEEANLREKELLRQKEENHKQREQLSIELPKLVQVAQFMQWLDEKQSVREAMATTEQTLTLLGWMPRDKVDLLEDRLQKVYKAVTILRVKPEADEDAPVLLKNANFVTPFESVTNLYGLPLSRELDPTTALSPFFILFFALCLTDAGYGVVIAAIFGIVLWKTKKTIDEARLLWLLFFGGIATVLVSIPFGGWFGLTPEQVPGFLTKQTANGLYFRGQIWNLNQQTGVEFLQNLSLILGITHLFFGMFLAGYHKWIHGKKQAAFWLDFTSHILLGGVLFKIFAPAGLEQLGTLALALSLALFIWGKGYGSPLLTRPLKGVLGLLNFAIGMLSNGLSYLRILALGLVTGAIAAAVNQVAVEIGNLFPVFIAIPIIIVIFVLGHLVSIALNTLGSFIHSGRLQFIEFFSQFFEGGGKQFSPFKRSLS